LSLPGSSQFGSITAPIPSTAGLSVSSSTLSPNSTQALTPKPAPPFQHTMHTHTRNPSLDFFGKFVENAKKKEMTGLARGYLDELLKHEDDPLYWVKANDGADNHDKRDGKIGGQHADGMIRPDTEVSLLDLDSDIPFITSGNDDGDGIGNGHRTKQKQPQNYQTTLQNQNWNRSQLHLYLPLFQFHLAPHLILNRLRVQYLCSLLPLRLPAAMSHILCWTQHCPWSALHLCPLLQPPHLHPITHWRPWVPDGYQVFHPLCNPLHPVWMTILLHKISSQAHLRPLMTCLIHINISKHNPLSPLHASWHHIPHLKLQNTFVPVSRANVEWQPCLCIIIIAQKCVLLDILIILQLICTWVLSTNCWQSVDYELTGFQSQLLCITVHALAWYIWQYLDSWPTLRWLW